MQSAWTGYTNNMDNPMQLKKKQKQKKTNKPLHFILEDLGYNHNHVINKR